MFDREGIRWECCTAFYEEHQKTSEVINSNGRGWLDPAAYSWPFSSVSDFAFLA
jgi:hypothetical protein